MKIRLSKLALAELDDILAAIEAVNPIAAARFDARIKRVFERIAQFPKAHRK
jgi:plasmid stabilization system protein ParE